MQKEKVKHMMSFQEIVSLRRQVTARIAVLNENVTRIQDAEGKIAVMKRRVAELDNILRDFPVYDAVFNHAQNAVEEFESFIINPQTL
jgi:hypothetical protein